jgi:predicted nucleic acid-binding protein
MLDRRLTLKGAQDVALDLLLSTLVPHRLKSKLAAQGGLLRRDWDKSHGVGMNDALIAASSLQTQRVLISLNAKHYPMRLKALLLVHYANN